MQMKRPGRLIPRRSFLGCGASALLVAGRALSQGFSSSHGHFRPLREVKNAVLLAMAPDCRRVCLWLTRKPVGRFTQWAAGDRRGIDHDPPSSDILAILEIDTLKEIFSAPLPGEPMEFSFFLGGEAIYGVTEPHALDRKLAGRVQMVFDLPTGRVERLPAPFGADTTYYTALRDRTLIGVRDQRELFRMEWPSLHELASTTLNGRIHGGLSLAGNRQGFIHVVDQSLVCRRTEDFRVIWDRQIDASIDLSATLNGRGVPGPSLSIVYKCFSADGSTAAIGACRGNNIGAPMEFYVEILNGKDGTPIARWRQNPGDGLALSPDGKLIAIAELGEAGNNLESTVHVHEIPSGRKLGTLVHDRVARSRRLGATMNASPFGFTDDGKYFVTANSYKIKIWQIELN